MKIRTLPVYSKLAGEIETRQLGLWDKLPVNADGSRWRLSQHQVETYKALIDPNGPDVVFNTAMTGDGKSLAAYLYALQNQAHVIAMYPTNELIRDQEARIAEYIRDWKSKSHSGMMDGARITELMEENDTRSRVEQIRRLLERNAFLLTNPDLFHLMMNFKYGHQNWEQKELPFEVPANFDYFIFDEFHIFGVPQVISVMNAISYLSVLYRHKPNEQKRFIFLSATPHPLMNRLLAHSGLSVQEVSGQYSSQSSSEYRLILQPCELHFDFVDRERSVEQWVKIKLDEIIQFYRSYPNSKGAIIVNSAAAARRLKLWLTCHLPSDISVGENTGLTGKDERKDSLNKQLLVGTSTVDIGIDFRINLLIFEATDAGKFIQRFGRLGRHAGFMTYRAYALLPKFIKERFEQHWSDGSDVERTEFSQSVREIFPTEQEFDHYAKRWGKWQTTHLLAQVERSLPKGMPFVDDFTAQLDQTFARPDDYRFSSLVKQYWGKIKEKNWEALFDELTSFRGQSSLSCGLWDQTDNQLKTYELFFLLANTEFEVLSEDEFMAEVQRRNLPAREFRQQLLYVRVLRYVEERESYILGLKQDLLSHEEWLHQAIVLKGFYIKDSNQLWINAVNRALQGKQLVCVISDKLPVELKRQLWLPPLFPIHRLSDRHDSDFSVAFGHSALLLDSLLFYRKTNTNQAIIT